jgi:hypothetical protein
MSDPLCPRCLSIADHSPEDKECSDRCITRHLARVAVLESAIREHRDAKADDRCIEDDDSLYEALGDGIKCDRRVGDKADMLINCARFIEKRCEGGGWPSYVELETQLAGIRDKLRALDRHHGFLLKDRDADTVSTNAVGRASDIDALL